MWALIAFIALGIVVATLIEVNERIKRRKSKAEGQTIKEDCKQEKPSKEECSACELMAVCEKKDA
ncbi:MAG: hypothetical protein J5761_03825 [Paludibacteraceae bacterium]|nr:hypothetical protein [Paludibacteraceae bacterium]